MWQEEKNAYKNRNRILAGLCLLVALSLLIAMVFTRKKTKQEEALLKEEYLKQQDSQTLARQSAVEEIEAEYRKDLDTVAQYLPGIVCWGDTLTAGSSGSVSYPLILQRCLDTYICDIYDFRSTIKNASEYSRLDWESYTVSIPVVNMGVIDEDTNTVLGRSGVVPFVLEKGVTIPAETEPVEIRIISQNGEDVTPLKGGNGGVNDVSIDGIAGTITLETDATHGSGHRMHYYFTRSEAGSAVSVAAKTPIITAASDMYKDYFHIVWIGTYGGYDNSTELVEQIKTLLARQTNCTDCYLVLGLCYRNGWKDTSSLDNVMIQAFGDHYINVRKYLCSDGMADAQLNITDDDEYSASHEIVPPSLRSSNGDAGLSAKAYTLIGKLVYDRMEKMGYLREITDELGIEEVRKNLLKDNPDYFVNIMKNW